MECTRSNPGATRAHPGARRHKGSAGGKKIRTPWGKVQRNRPEQETSKRPSGCPRGVLGAACFSLGAARAQGGGGSTCCPTKLPDHRVLTGLFLLEGLGRGGFAFFRFFLAFGGCFLWLCFWWLLLPFGGSARLIFYHTHSHQRHLLVFTTHTMQRHFYGTNTECQRPVRACQRPTPNARHSRRIIQASTRIHC